MERVFDEQSRLVSQQLTNNVKHLHFSRSQVLTGFFFSFCETHSMLMVCVSLDCYPNAQFEVALPAAFTVVLFYDHVLTFGEEVNLAA